MSSGNWRIVFRFQDGDAFDVDLVDDHGSKGARGMPMKNPPHPGRSIKDACLDPLGLSVTTGAKVLGVTRNTLSRVINGQSGISPEMAIRLEKAGWSNADHWLRLQTAYELAQARRRQDRIVVERYKPSPAA
jgi:addiction module HigA family antidote